MITRIDVTETMEEMQGYREEIFDEWCEELKVRLQDRYPEAEINFSSYFEEDLPSTLSVATDDDSEFTGYDDVKAYMGHCWAVWADPHGNNR